MGYVTHISTSYELQIASNLSQARAKIFLETRYYMRVALSALFNIHPMKIPITAQPGEPPKLPNGMGYISISHCKDAFIIGWYPGKIGIDIERSDRNFNYQTLAKKYFQKANIENQNFNKYSILKEWRYQINKKNLYHKSKKIKLNLVQITYLDWTISIAYKDKILENLPTIICSNL